MKDKPLMIYGVIAIVLFGSGAIVWKQIHPLDYLIIDVIAGAFTVIVALVCWYFGSDVWHHITKKNVQSEALPYQQVTTTKIDEANAKQKDIPLTRRTVKQLPPMRNRGFLGIGGKSQVRNPISQSSVNTSSHAVSPHNGMGNIPQSGAAKSGMGNGISDDIPQNGMGNLQQSGMGKDIPLDALADKRKRIFDFFTQFPNATLKEAEGKLEIPNSTIDRIKKDLISKGAWS